MEEDNEVSREVRANHAKLRNFLISHDLHEKSLSLYVFKSFKVEVENCSRVYCKAKNLPTSILGWCSKQVSYSQGFGGNNNVMINLTWYEIVFV